MLIWDLQQWAGGALTKAVPQACLIWSLALPDHCPKSPWQHLESQVENPPGVAGMLQALCQTQSPLEPHLGKPWACRASKHCSSR